MSSLRAALDAHVARSRGIVTRAELVELGFARSGADALVRRGVVVPVFPGVYRSAAWPAGLRQTLVAVCRRNPDAVISHTTAGQEWRIRGMSDVRIHALVPHGSSPELSRVTVHRCRAIDPSDVAEQADGVRLTTPPRTLFDAASLIGPNRTESALEHLLAEAVCSMDDIGSTFARLAHGGRPGSRELGEVLRRRPAWSEAVESGLELRVVQALRRAGFPEPVRQLSMILPSGRSIRIDLAFPQWKLAIEIDHPYWHAGRRAFELDRDRDRQLAVLGWRVVRLTEADLGSKLPNVLADLLRLAAAPTA